MKYTVKWYGRFSPIAVYKNGQILSYKNGKFYIIDENELKLTKCKIPLSLCDSLIMSNRLSIRLFRKDIRTSCITENEDVYFFIDKELFCYRKKKDLLRKLYRVPSSKSTPLNIIPAIKGTGYTVLWGDYFSNESREEVSIWGLKKDGTVNQVYQFPKNSIRHIHNIIFDDKKKGYYIFTGDNEKLAGIYHSDSQFNDVYPVYAGNQRARAVQGFCTDDGLIYATDSVNENNYICFLAKNNGGETEEITSINGSCIYAGKCNDIMFFSTTVESPETEDQNRFLALLSTKRGRGILSDKVDVLRVKRNHSVEKVLEFQKDKLPYKLFQYGVVQFPPNMSGKLVFYPVGVKNRDGQIGILEEC